jgi:hypothetical protein
MQNETSPPSAGVFLYLRVRQHGTTPRVLAQIGSVMGIPITRASRGIFGILGRGISEIDISKKKKILQMWVLGLCAKMPKIAKYLKSLKHFWHRARVKSIFGTANNQRVTPEHSRKKI